MNTSRRTFLRKGLTALASTPLLFTRLPRAFFKGRALGLQLYSVRDAMKADPSGTLRKIAAQQYDYVEHANYENRKFYGYSPADFRKLLSDLGLKMRSGHVRINGGSWDAANGDFTDEWKYTIEDAAEAGQELLIDSWLEDSIRTDYDALMKRFEIFNRSGALCKQSGLSFGYHNHEYEFTTMVQGRSIYDLMMENTDPSVVHQQLDIGHVLIGGADVLQLFAKYPGRFNSLHVKDVAKSNTHPSGYESVVLGTGLLDVKGISSKALELGIEYLIIEQEEYQGMDPLVAVEKDYQVMKGWNF